MTARIFTVGHSTHDAAPFAALLRRHGIAAIADVRRFPGSRRLPHFAAAELARWLPAHGIAYAHLPELGGRRPRQPGSPNGGWRIAAFQGYADHMGSDAFAAALARLEGLAVAQPTAVMCAEAPWWRCHRRLLADALVVRGWVVVHVLPEAQAREHTLTPFASVRDGRLSYPPTERERRG